jgi:hypothetical protein
MRGTTCWSPPLWRLCLSAPPASYTSGPGMACDYLDGPDPTASAILPNPFQLPGNGDSKSRIYCTGDIVMWLPTGIQRQAISWS